MFTLQEVFLALIIAALGIAYAADKIAERIKSNRSINGEIVNLKEEDDESKD